ncbi:MAG: carbohydrate ABC transporter permease [Bacillota bacterium]
MLDKLKKHLDLKQKRAVWGYLFISPFIIGFILFFIYPFFQSILFSVSEINLTSEGFTLDFIGIDNYHETLFIDPDYNRAFIENIINMLINIPAVLIFSFFIASILNQKFRGRLLIRIIFFLPVILSAGIVKQMESQDFLQQVMMGASSAEEAGSMLGTDNVRQLLMQMKLNESFMEYIINSVDRIPQIINSSAIPILIFLAGLQSIPRDLYEAASIEGATAWESFWKITFPMVSSLILTNAVYVTVAYFTSQENFLVGLIQDTAWGGRGFGVGAAMGWIYFVGIAILLLIVYKSLSRIVFYHD